MEMRCYRKILRISYDVHVTNEEVRAKIQQAIGPHEDLLTIVKRRKLQWYCYVSRSSGLAKTIFQGTVKGGRRQCRQTKRLEDNIREWTGLEINAEKTKLTTNNISGINTDIKVNGQKLETVTSFKYLRLVIIDEGPSRRYSPG